ncbi:hypothetical protein AB0C60_33895, partial [Streptomyces sp. NPDC048845]
MRKHPIRRLLLTSAATVSGVVLLLALKSPSLLPGPAASDSPPPAAAGAQPAPGGDAPAGTAGDGQAGGGPDALFQQRDRLVVSAQQSRV